MDHTVDLTEQQLRDAQRVFDMSAINGIIAIAAGLRGQGLLDDRQVNFVFDAMSKPLSNPEVASNPAVEMMQNFISNRFAAILTHKDAYD
jgi:hypothetical protein